MKNELKILNEVVTEIIPVIKQGDSVKFRKTNKSFSENYLQEYSHKNVDYKRYGLQLQQVDKLYNSLNRPLKVLEIGTQFGITSLAIKKKYPDFTVVTLDKLEYIEDALIGMVEYWKEKGLDFIDCDLYDEFQQNQQYDVILFCSVIEHLPNSPKQVLNNINNVLSEEGILILDMPNLASYYNRYKMLFYGEGPFWPIESFFDCEIPFTGHHREYNIKELSYMLQKTGFFIDEKIFFTISNITGIRSFINHFFQKNK